MRACSPTMLLRLIRSLPYWQRYGKIQLITVESRLIFIKHSVENKIMYTWDNTVGSSIRVNPTTLTYIAGFLDGDGCIKVTISKRDYRVCGARKTRTLISSRLNRGRLIRLLYAILSPIESVPVGREMVGKNNFS